MLILFSLLSFLIIILAIILVTSNIVTITATNNNLFGTNSLLAYSNLDQIRSNLIRSSIDIQSIPTKKVHVGDIDLAYKILGKDKRLSL